MWMNKYELPNLPLEEISPDFYITVKEASASLGRSRTWIYRFIYQDLIKSCVRSGRTIYVHVNDLFRLKRIIEKIDKWGKYEFKEGKVMVDSRDKGARGERMFCADHEEALGIPLKRGVQFGKGNCDNPDVYGLKGVHYEIKNTKRFNMVKAQEQVLGDCGPNVPVIGHRYTRGEWWVIVPLNQLRQYAMIVVEAMGYKIVKDKK